jgi:hypothetical protein
LLGGGKDPRAYVQGAVRADVSDRDLDQLDLRALADVEQGGYLPVRQPAANGVEEIRGVYRMPCGT